MNDYRAVDLFGGALETVIPTGFVDVRCVGARLGPFAWRADRKREPF
jgi:hypothetical protein